ncbi:hypothetical protein GCM10023084_41490 [Streptomyces lacrimifluminis]|uniref:Uncharacterized protein n=1 Tax=Streptomyces lacrimifluminis TaxID=1500077 RepID=A0A917L5I9_9ACTN|nr:hypothetical protein [Streptomyces lacrimifluminis]GGJ41674.1 hypothetical protein GCM10012282_43120 [Streptomyces lacrimifluminis]
MSSPAQAFQPTTASQVVDAGHVAAPTGKWKVKVTFFGRSGEDIPLRQGDLNFGYVHIQDGHPINDTSLYGYIDKTLDSGNYGSPSGGKVTVRYNTGSGTFRVVFSEREDSQSGDGRPVGIITAFME